MRMSDPRPRQAATLEVNEADDGLVIYDPANDMVHHLNATASVVFDLCDGNRDADDIAGVLAEAYGLDSPPRDHALTALTDLSERKLIHWDAHSGAAG